MLDVVRHLLDPAPIRLVDRRTQRPGHDVRIQDHPAVHIAGSPADGLHERGVAAQKALLVRVQDRHQRAFRDIQPLTQQVDADQHVEHAQAQVADDFDSLQRINVGMEVAHLYPVFGQVLGQVLGHAFGEGRDQNAPATADDDARLGEQIVDLPLDRPDFGHRVDEAGGADDLFGKRAAGAFHLPRARRRAHEHRLRAERVPLLEPQRPVVEAAWQPKAEFAQDALSRGVTPGHAADLRDRHVAFIDDEQRVLRQVLKQRGRRFAGHTAGQVPRVVLDRLAAARRLHHLDVERAALLQALGLEQLALLGELLQAVLQLDLDVLDRLLQRGPGRDIMAVGVDMRLLKHVVDLTRQRVELAYALDLVAKQADAPGAVLQMARPDVDAVAT